MKVKKRIERLERQVKYLTDMVENRTFDTRGASTQVLSDFIDEWDTSQMTEADIKGIARGMRDARTPAQTEILEALLKLIPEDQANIVLDAIIDGGIPSVYIGTNFSNMMVNFPK